MLIETSLWLIHTNVRVWLPKIEQKYVPCEQLREQLPRDNSKLLTLIPEISRTDFLGVSPFQRGFYGSMYPHIVWP